MQQAVTFKHGSWKVAGNLYLPPNFSKTEKYAAIVCVHPGSSVKEQTTAIYGSKLAAAGFVALTFDASHQGESDGEPRYLENADTRVEDIRCAVDFLSTCDYIDEDRIGILGICAGGGIAARAAMTERRLKAVGTVAATNAARAFNELDDPIAVLEQVAKQRTAEAHGATPHITPWIPNTPEEAKEAGITDMDTLEAVDYYRTSRGNHPNSCNKMLFTSMSHMIGFDAFHLADRLLTQPLKVIVGDRVGSFGSYRDGYDLYHKAASTQKSIHVVPGANHYDLYDQPQATSEALEQLIPFYKENLL